MTDFRRADRVARLLQEELSVLLRKEVKDPRVRDVTITRVVLTDDLRDATVHFTPLGALSDDERVAGLQAGLDRAAPFLQGRLGRALRLRSTPRLRFTFDRGVRNLVDVHELLATLPAALDAAPSPSEGEGGDGTPS